MKESKRYEYEKIWEGKPASATQMILEEGGIMTTVMGLFNKGIVVGQHTLEGDVEYRLNPMQPPFVEPTEEEVLVYTHEWRDKTLNGK